MGASASLRPVASPEETVTQAEHLVVALRLQVTVSCQGTAPGKRSPMLISYDSLLIGGEWVRQSAAWSSASGPSLGTCGACGSPACGAVGGFVLADLAPGGTPRGE